MIVINLYIGTLVEIDRIIGDLTAEKFVYYYSVTRLERPFKCAEFEEAYFIVQIHTRATLYNDIEAFLESNYADKSYFMVSTPVVNCPKKVMSTLRLKTTSGLPG